jgi:hypothetical protein
MAPAGLRTRGARTRHTSDSAAPQVVTCTASGHAARDTAIWFTRPGAVSASARGRGRRGGWRRRPRPSPGFGTWTRRSSRYRLRAAGIDEDLIGQQASPGAEDGECRNFHRSVRALPAAPGHTRHTTCCYDIAGHSHNSRPCRVPGPAPKSKPPYGRPDALSGGVHTGEPGLLDGASLIQVPLTAERTSVRRMQPPACPLLPVDDSSRLAIYNGAHAAVTGYRRLTRDVQRYRTYFSGIDITAPPPAPQDTTGS